MTKITIRKNTKATITCLKKKREKKAGFQFFFARAVPIRGLIFRSKNVKLSRASQKCHFPHFFLSKTLDFIWNRILVISLDGWRIGHWNLHRCSSWVFSIASTKFHLDRERRFSYEFIVEKLVLLSFHGYLGEIESGGGKSWNFSCNFFVNVQCCVRVSASNFQVLTCKSGGARALVNIVRFWLAQLVPWSSCCTMIKLLHYDQVTILWSSTILWSYCATIELLYYDQVTMLWSSYYTTIKLLYYDQVTTLWSSYCTMIKLPHYGQVTTLWSSCYTDQVTTLRSSYYTDQVTVYYDQVTILSYSILWSSYYVHNRSSSCTAVLKSLRGQVTLWYYNIALRVVGQAIYIHG